MPAPREDLAPLRDAAVGIWQAGVDAVRSDRLVQSAIACDGCRLRIGDEEWTAGPHSRIIVVGGGKAGAGMAAGLEQALGPDWLATAGRVVGWVNVPADCVRPLQRIHLHAGRPAGVNEPTAAGVVGAERIISLVEGAGPEDLCLVLLSGGGSALLPAPVEGITLAEKLAVTRLLMRGGARIDELNCVRKQLSRIKGGGLARQCRAGRMITLIISDVCGDPLDVIASGPTAPNLQSAAEALATLERFAPDPTAVPASVWRVLEAAVERERSGVPNPPAPVVSNQVIGNNRTAVEAAAVEARRRGFVVERCAWDEEGLARDVGTAIAEECLRLRDDPTRPAQTPSCIISGGEPVVRVVSTDRPQKGGRNQEVALAATARLWDDSERITILSGGTDGEDGPTNAAGGIGDGAVIASARRQGLDPQEFLLWNNSYPFLAAAGGLLITGPTQTNVMDLRIALVDD